MTEKYQLYVVPHTHWDREWYGSFQLFRLRLVRLMNKLLDILERDPEYATFNLDGQTIILDDYLEIHPEKRPLLQQLIRDKRLMVGPWYILPDEFLTSGESLVRNLLLGKQMATEFGHRMDVGYIPDTFGHIAQLPQILRGFGLDTCMNFRGLDSGNRHSELWWEAPDGSRVLLHHMSTIIGYSDLGAMAADPQRAAYDLRATAYYKAERTTGNILLAMQGVDHVEARADLPQIIGIANDTFDDIEFIHASLEDFWTALKQAVNDKNLETVTGELRDVPRSEGSVNYLLYNVLSSRADNKLMNARTLISLEHWAEAWSTLAWLWGVADYPRGHLWTAWKWLLKNHPHDSIGGCSVDEVHRQMMTRFEWAKEIADYLTEERFWLIAEQTDMADAADDEIALMVFNGTPYPRDEIVTVDIDLPEYWLRQQAVAKQSPPVTLTPDSHYLDVKTVHTRADWGYANPDLPEVFFRGIYIRPVEGEPVPVQMHSIDQTTKAIALASGPRGVIDIRRVRASFRANIPAYGYATYYVKTDAKPIHWQPQYNPPINCLENEYMTVTVNPNGTFDLHLHNSEHVYRNLGRLDDSGDNGDGYTFSPPLFNRAYSTHTASPRIARVGTGVNVQHIRIEYDFALPRSLDDARQQRRDETVICPITVDLRLRDGSPLLEVSVTIDNRARDHRLRMHFPTGLRGVTEASSAMQFDVMTRPTKPQPIQPGDWWVESPPETFPMHGWMDVHGDSIGLSVIAEGVYEFGVDGEADNSEIALTLLRAVGYLGARRDTTTIVGGAGPGIPTPEAQLQQTLTYRMALYPHEGDWQQARVSQQAQTFLTQPRSLTTVPQSGTLPSSRAGLQVAGDDIVLCSVKQSEDGEATIVRVYNPSNRPSQAHITLDEPVTAVQKVDLQEAVIEAIAIADDVPIRVDLPAKSIVTVKVYTA